MSFEFITESDRSPKALLAMGGKAASLSLARSHGLLVPHFFVIPASTLERVYADFYDHPNIGEAQREAGPAIPEEFKERLLAELHGLPGSDFAVRSSAVVEDGVAKSFAGQFESYLNVQIENCPEYIGRCWSSRKNARAATYSQLTNIPMAVIVQELVEADVSGVCFTHNPLLSTAPTMVVEAIRGLAEPLVQGAVTPDHFEVDRVTGKLVNYISGHQTEWLRPRKGQAGCEMTSIPVAIQSITTLDTVLLEKIFSVAQRAESVYDMPVDIEWAVRKNELFVLQIRPITAHQ